MVNTSPIPAPTPATGTSSVPALSHSDHGRINAWFVHEAFFLDIALELRISTTELATWATQPHIVQALDLVRSAIKLRTESLYWESKYASLSRLTRIVRSNPNDEIARRAADRILRPSSNPDYQPPKPREQNPPLPEGGVGVDSSDSRSTPTGRANQPRESISSDSSSASIPNYIPGVDPAPTRSSKRTPDPATPSPRTTPATSAPSIPTTIEPLIPITSSSPDINVLPPRPDSTASRLAASAGSSTNHKQRTIREPVISNSG